MKILRQRKDKRSLTQYVMAEEAENDKGAMLRPAQIIGVLRLQPSTPQQCSFVFSRMRTDKTPNSSAFQRLKGGK